MSHSTFTPTSTQPFRPRVMVVGGVPMTTTWALAEHCGIGHDRLYRQIREMLRDAPLAKDAEFVSRQFAKTEQLDALGKRHAIYRMTRTGLGLLRFHHPTDQTRSGFSVYIRTLLAMEEAYRQPMKPVSPQPVQVTMPSLKQFDEWKKAADASPPGTFPLHVFEGLRSLGIAGFAALLAGGDAQKSYVVH